MIRDVHVINLDGFMQQSIYDACAGLRCYIIGMVDQGTVEIAKEFPVARNVQGSIQANVVGYYSDLLASYHGFPQTLFEEAAECVNE